MLENILVDYSLGQTQVTVKKQQQQHVIWLQNFHYMQNIKVNKSRIKYFLKMQ
jgi:hypothetical protein